MEDVVMSAATGALGPVMGKLVALLGDEYKRLRGIRAEIQSLELELKSIDAFLQNMAEEEYPNPQDKAWMKEVRELSYDVEDSLDDFMARVVADKSFSKPDGFMDKIKGSLKRVKARHDIAKAIEDLKKQALEVSQRNASYRDHAVSNSGDGPPRVDRRALAIFDDVSKLVGVDGPKNELLQLLADCESTQTKLVAIVGFGGLGKTTIANQIYQELKGQFKYRAFLSVARNPDIKRVMSNIYSQLDEKYYPLNEDLQTIITKIRDFLDKENKRYIIVVDDIWKVDEWDAIKCAFPRTSSGSKIITTTRINDVAESCRSSFSGHIYNLRPLNMTQSRQLLYIRLFNSEEKCPLDLEEISGQILEKCAGLPLAIVAISGVLAGKRSKMDQWERVKDSVGRALRNSCIETMVNIISLSYLDLPPNLRTCLLYLSIFPEDHIILKDNLIRRWIGEGFIQNRSGYTVHESGEMCFNELINRSLIQPVGIDSSFGGPDVTSCRVHDTVHDFIVSKAVEDNFVTIIGVPGVANPDPRNKVCRLSLQNDGETPPGLVVSNARSLHVFGRNVKIPPLLEFPLLRVMDFEECWQLEDNDLAGIGTLLHLKYLRFRHAHSVTKLPEELARLQQLEIDIYEYKKVMKIPEIIQQRLVCYVTLVADRDVTLPNEIVCIQGLRALVGVSVYMQSIEFLEGLGNLKHLTNLGIRFEYYDIGMLYDEEDNPDYWKKQQEEVIFSINKLGKASLKSLHIINNDAGMEYIEMIEESWFPRPPYGIQELVIEGYYVKMVPEWMASLVNLEKLQLPIYKMGEEGVEILGGLPSLRNLNIDWFDSDDEEQEVEVARAMQAHPNRPTLAWTYMD